MSTNNLILLAMEESPTLGLLERALYASGYAVAIARDIASLDKSLMETSPTLVVLTNQLDGKSGLKLSAGILERFPTLPIVLFASQDDPQFRFRISPLRGDRKGARASCRDQSRAPPGPQRPGRAR